MCQSEHKCYNCARDQNLFCTNDKMRSSWGCGNLTSIGEGRNGLSIPRGSYPRVTPMDIYPCFFCTYCPFSGHKWTAILILIDRSASSFINLPLFTTSSIFAKHLFISIFFSFYMSILSLLLIFLLFFISNGIHSIAGPIDSCSI